MDIHHAQKLMRSLMEAGPKGVSTMEVFNDDGVRGTLRAYKHPRGVLDRELGEPVTFARLEVRTEGFTGMVPVRSGADVVFHLDRLGRGLIDMLVSKGQVWYSCRQLKNRMPFLPLMVMSFKDGEVLCARGGKDVSYLLESFWVDSLHHQFGFSRTDFYADLRARSERYDPPSQSEMFQGCP